MSLMLCLHHNKMQNLPSGMLTGPDIILYAHHYHHHNNRNTTHDNEYTVYNVRST